MSPPDIGKGVPTVAGGNVPKATDNVTVAVTDGTATAGTDSQVKALARSSSLTMPPSLAGQSGKTANRTKEELDAAFAVHYPFGLAEVRRVIEVTAENDEGHCQYREPEHGWGFYIKDPNGAPALISTGGDPSKFRRMSHPLPARLVHLWTKDEIQNICNTIRKVFWDLMQHLPQPQQWEDIWQWFDSEDCWKYGLLNLWNVMSHIYAENVVISHTFNAERALEIGRWADSWLDDPVYADRLRKWTPEASLLSNILDEKEMESMAFLDVPVIVPMMISALTERRRWLLADDRKRWIPKHLTETIKAGELHNFLGTYPDTPFKGL